MPRLGTGNTNNGPRLGVGREAPLTASVREEGRLAEELGGRRVPASGSLPGRPGDVELRHFLIDRKGTKNATMISIVLSDLVKITREASGLGLCPAMLYAFEGVEDVGGSEKEWVLIPKSVFAKVLAAGQDRRLED